MRLIEVNEAGRVLRLQEFPDTWTVSDGELTSEAGHAMPGTWYPAPEGVADGDTYDSADDTITKPAGPSLAELKARAIAAINHHSGLARLRFVTDSAFQETEYDLTLEEANAYKAAGYTGDVPPMVQAEVDAQDITAREATDFIIATANTLRTAAAAIRTHRRAGIVAIEAASTAPAIDTIRDDTLAALDLIRPG